MLKLSREKRMEGKGGANASGVSLKRLSTPYIEIN